MGLGVTSDRVDNAQAEGARTHHARWIARYDQTGLIWLLQGRRVVELIRPQQAPLCTAGTTNPLLGRSATAWTILRRPLLRTRATRRPSSIMACRGPSLSFCGSQMSKGQWTFRPAALKRAIKAAQEAGLTVSGFWINPQGEIHIETSKAQAQDSAGDLDRWLATTAGGK